VDISIIPTNDEKQALRLRRFFMAVISYGLWVALGLAGYFGGVLPIKTDLSLPIHPLLLIVGGIVISNSVVFVVIRSGLNKLFTDPSLTLFQCMVAMCWILALMYFSPPARDLMLMVYVMTMLFGMFQLSRGELVFLALFALAGYGFLLASEGVFDAGQAERTRESLHFAVLSVMVIWCAYFGNYVGRLKQTLRQQNRDLRRSVESVTYQADRDDLTRAYSRRFIMGSLDQEKIRADDKNQTFSICIFDLDHFKRVNDRFGHLAGDQVLAEFTLRASSVLRTMDQVRRRGHPMGRYGGEEFIVLLPATGLPGAVNCAERIRELTAERKFVDNIKVTVSVGVSQYRANEDVKETIRRADEALYVAKSAGRNKVHAEPRFDGPQGKDTHSETVLADRG
jgi:diguanylate cyclase (GGDEF)-like protein